MRRIALSPRGPLSKTMRYNSKALVAYAIWTLAGLACTTSASAQTIDAEVVFDCSGELTGVVQTDGGPRATGHVELAIDLPDGATWRSSGVVVIHLPPSVQEQNVVGKKISRCIGEAQMSAEWVDTIHGVDIWSIQLTPTRIRLRVGNKRIDDPTSLGFSTTAGGSPNV